MTGLGAITPLGVGKLLSRPKVHADDIGLRKTWTRLINGECGIKSLGILGKPFQELQCQVGGLVPLGSKLDGRWSPQEWLTRDVCESIPLRLR